MGASVENQHLQAALLQRIKELEKCELMQQRVSEISAAKSERDRPIIKLENGSEIEARLIIGSDGENSMTRRKTLNG